MGSTTPVYKLYKPDSDEIVSVDTHLNGNWEILDLNVRQLMEYRYTNVTSLNDSLLNTQKPMHKWYKTWSNAILYEGFDGLLRQDAIATVDDWISAKSLLRADWKEAEDNNLFYRVSSAGDVEWMGSAQLKTGGLITPFSTYGGVLTLPVAIQPTRSYYFTQPAGNCTEPGYSIARMIFSRLGVVDIQRYGTAPINSTQNRIDLSGISYNKNMVNS